MKYVIAALALFATTGAHAACGWVTVDNRSQWVCDNRQQNNSGGQTCGWVVVDGKSYWVCS